MSGLRRSTVWQLMMGAKEKSMIKASDLDPGLLRTLVNRIALVEAKNLALGRYLVDKGIISREDLESWMEEHDEEVREAHRGFFDALKVELDGS